MSTYLLFGAGRMAKAVLSHLVRDLGMEAVYLVDKRPAAVEKLVGLADDPRVMAFEGDMGDAIFDIEGLKVCIATCGYAQYEGLTSDCVAAGVSMVDLGGNRDVVAKQKTFHEVAAQRGVTIIPDCGLAPGMVNIVGMHAFRQLDSFHCKDIHIKMRVGGLPVEVPYGNPLGYELVWSADGLINEYLMPSEELIGGRQYAEESLTDLETLVAQDGKTYEAFRTGGGSSNLPRLLEGKAQGVSYKTIRYPGHCQQMLAMKFLGLFEGEARQILTKNLEARATMNEYKHDKVICIVEGTGLNPDLVRMSVRYEMHMDGVPLTMSAMAKTTGFSAAIVAQMIADGRIDMKGVVDGEEAVPGDLFLDALYKAGIHFSRS